MFSNKKKFAPSLIANDVTVEGAIISKGMMQLDGKIKGQVSVESLTIGVEGCIEGNVEAQEIIIKGQVNGTVRADKVELEKTARVTGDVFHGTISIEEGAVIDGSMKQQAAKLVADAANSEKVTKIKEPAKKLG